MAGVSNSQLLDLQKTTLRDLPDLEFEVALDYQNYPVCNQWFQGDKKKIQSGYEISRRIVLDTSGNATHVRLYQKTAINVSDIQYEITAPWVQAQTHYSIERREALRNRAPARYIDLLSSRRMDGTLDLADLLEKKAWECPSSATDDLLPRGLTYWISMLASGASDGFNGLTIRWGDGTGTPATTTTDDKAGIDPTTETKWRNYAAEYVAINAAFVKSLRKAFHATNFKSPMLAQDLAKGPASNYRIYMALDELCEYEDLVTNANDNLGRDLDPFHGNTTFKRVPIIYTPVLDDKTKDPVYGVNHGKFYPVVQDGDWMRESEPMMDVEQHNVTTTFIDCSYNFFCSNVRESGFVLHEAW